MFVECQKLCSLWFIWLSDNFLEMPNKMCPIGTHWSLLSPAAKYLKNYQVCWVYECKLSIEEERPQIMCPLSLQRKILSHWYSEISQLVLIGMEPSPWPLDW